MGDVADFRNFMGAVIDRRAFARIRGLPRGARKRDPGVTILAGGGADDSVGYFIAADAAAGRGSRRTALMCEEIFGPVLTAHVYPGGAVERDARAGGPDRARTRSPARCSRRTARALVEADRALRHAAGNYYVNDKPTGAVVGQQPFGGARASGTNDKAGSMLNLLRWVSPRSIKETLVPPKDYRYPFMAEA